MVMNQCQTKYTSKTSNTAISDYLIVLYFYHKVECNTAISEYLIVLYFYHKVECNSFYLRNMI